MKRFKKIMISALIICSLSSMLQASASKDFPAAFKQTTQTIKGKAVTYVTIDMNDSHVAAKVSTANSKMNQAASLKDMALSGKATASINGTYFAAYNGDMPLPDGTIVKNGKPLHITDMGCTVGFTADNQVYIDFVKTRVQGYINGKEHWISYRVNRPTPDPSATVIYTEEYVGNISLSPDLVGVVCQDGQVIKKVTGTVTVPKAGFILSMNVERSSKFNIGDSVTYKTTFAPTNNTSEDWANVTEAISAGPSLLINGKSTPLPKEEGFTESKILTQAAQRSFIGTNAKNQLIIGTTSANISQMKEIAKALGLVNAMCLDGGASSGLYYKNQYLTTPGRKINNCISFIYQK